MENTKKIKFSTIYENDVLFGSAEWRVTTDGKTVKYQQRKSNAKTWATVSNETIETFKKWADDVNLFESDDPALIAYRAYE